MEEPKIKGYHSHLSVKFQNAHAIMLEKERRPRIKFPRFTKIEWLNLLMIAAAVAFLAVKWWASMSQGQVDPFIPRIGYSGDS